MQTKAPINIKIRDCSAIKNADESRKKQVTGILQMPKEVAYSP